MNNAAVRYVVTLAVGLITGLLLGSSFSRMRSHTAARDEVAAKSTLSKSESARVAVGRRVGKNQLSSESPDVILGNIITVPFQELYGVLSDLSPEKLNNLAAQLGDLPDSKDSAVKIASFFKAWAHFDPMAALRAASKFKLADAKTTALQAVVESADTTQAESLAREVKDWPANLLTQGQRQTILSAAIAKWSQLSPSDAAKFFDSAQLNMMSSNSAAWNIAQNWAAIDPQAALDWSEAHNQARGYNSAMNGAIVGWWSKDHTAAENYALSQSKTNFSLISSLTSYIASRDPERAKEWAAKLPDADQRRNADTMIAMQLSYSDPKAASSWAASLPSDVRERALTSTVNMWASNDLTAAGEWINSLSGAPRDEALGAYTNQLLQKDPAVAATWAITIADQKIRDRSLDRVASTWLNKDPAAASAWIQASNLSDADKKRLRAQKPGG